jgi:hypothetical protein
MTPFEHFCMYTPEKFTGRPNITVEIPESGMREYRAAWAADRTEAAKWRKVAERLKEYAETATRAALAAFNEAKG